MGALERYGSPAKVQRIGNDSIYGTGSDGNMIIASSTSLSRDMYYNNLTINNGVMLNTNGFRVFVKETLTLNGNIGVGRADTANTGTISGQLNVATNATISIGGNAFGNTYTASTMPMALLNDVSTAILGYYIDTNSNTKVITGGAGGGNGVAGTVTPGVAGTVTPGVAGTVTYATNGSGAGTGGAGVLNRNTSVPGGRGTNGTNGAAGSTPAQAAAGTIAAASAGTTPPAASAGVGAKGGPLVIVVAKAFAGTGYILSQGSNSTAGGPSATGTGAGAAATSTNAGVASTGTGATNGAAGTPAPGVSLSHIFDGTVPFRIGDGVHGSHSHMHAPNVPHDGHIGAGYDQLHGYTYRHVHRGHDHAKHGQHSGHASGYAYGVDHSGGNYGHHYNDYTVSPPYSHYYGINGVDHSNSHSRPASRSTITDHGHHGNGNFTDRNSGSHATHYGSYNDAPVGTHFHFPAYHSDGGGQYPAFHAAADHGVFHYPRNHQDINYGSWRYRHGGTVSSPGHMHVAGGAGGAAGTNGTNGSTTAGTQASTTAGTNGSTTAGTNGQAGGGGGIIIVTETTPTGIQTSVAGGGVAGVSNIASSGTVVTVLNA